MERIPYWWEAAPRPESPPTPLPLRADVVVVGSGYTGLSAALTLSRNGREVVVIERQRPGEGASSRNLGLMSGALKIPFPTMIQKAGLPTALALYRESVSARAYLKHLIAAEHIECDEQPSGRLIAATTPSDYERLARVAELTHKHLGIETYALTRSEQGSELGTESYYGGAIDTEVSTFHPGRYHLGLLDATRAAGARIHHLTEVQAIHREGDGFGIVTTRGPVQARDVVVATNGYTTAGLPWWRRRVVPVPSQVVATEPIGNNLMTRLLPKRRAVVESNYLFHYFRSSPDGKRILFGGRYGGSSRKVEAGVYALRKRLGQVFPELEGIELTHTWDGFTGFTRDFLPHVGVVQGVHYAIGFCGSGTVWGTWLGHKIALKILGSSESHTAFDTTAPSIPFYRGQPWFLAPAMGWYGIRDRLQMR